MDPITKIICPVDFSVGSELGLARASELARVLGAELELLHVYQLAVLSPPEVGMTLDDLTRMKDQAQKKLNEYSARLRDQGLNVRTQLSEGNPAQRIVERAGEVTGSMLVLGTHGRTGFRRLMLGSVAEHVVRHATVPVLTIPMKVSTTRPTLSDYEPVAK